MLILPSMKVIGWQILALQADPHAHEIAKQAWHTYAEQMNQLSDTCSTHDLASEATWVQETLTVVLNQHAKPIRVNPRSKRWWNQEIRDARENYGQARRAWQAQTISTDSHKEARNSYYRMIRRTWEALMTVAAQGKSETGMARTWTKRDHYEEQLERRWLMLFVDLSTREGLSSVAALTHHQAPRLRSSFLGGTHRPRRPA
jgi:hypothetical protein